MATAPTTSSLTTGRRTRQHGTDLDATRKLHSAVTHTHAKKQKKERCLFVQNKITWPGPGRDAESHFIKREALKKPPWHRSAPKALKPFFSAQLARWSKAVVILDLFSIISQMLGVIGWDRIQTKCRPGDESVASVIVEDPLNPVCLAGLIVPTGGGRGPITHTFPNSEEHSQHQPPSPVCFMPGE